MNYERPITTNDSQVGVARVVLVDFLSAQPERTALNRDCRRAVSEALGREVKPFVIGLAKRQLGITHKVGSLSGKQGDTFVTYWTLPEELASQISGADRGVAKAMVSAAASNDNDKLASCLEQGRRRPDQVMTALAQIAANGKAPAK